jgi:hypothetical protein
MLLACDDDPAATHGGGSEIPNVAPPPPGKSAFDSERTWQLLGGKGVRGSWDAGVLRSRQIRSMALFKSDLYVGLGDAEAEPDYAQVWQFDGRSWHQVGGNGLNGSWSNKRIVGALVTDGTFLYAGLGVYPGDAEVWRYDGASWTQIGGDGLNGAWDDTHDVVWTLAFYRDELYAGLFTEKLGEQRPVLYRLRDSTWEYLAGDENPVQDPRGGWAKNDGIIMVYRLFADAMHRYLYIGLAGRDYTPEGAAVTNPGEVWRWDGESFEKIGGDGLNNSWDYEDTFFQEGLIEWNDRLLASLQLHWYQGRSAIWEWNGTSWRPFTDGHPEWTTIQNLNLFAIYNARLYVGAGLPSGRAATVWELQPDNSWRKVGGDGVLGSSWDRTVNPTLTQWVYTMVPYRGHLVIGLASAETPGGAEVWIY